MKSGRPGTVVVRYRVDCREVSVLTNYVDRSFAIANDGATSRWRWPGDARLRITSKYPFTNATRGGSRW